MVSRNYSAVVVNEALGMNLTQLDMVTVSSQEDIGLVQAVGGWNSLVGSTGKQVNSCSLAFNFCSIAEGPSPPPPILSPPTGMHWIVGSGCEHPSSSTDCNVFNRLYCPDSVELIEWHAAHLIHYRNPRIIE